MIHKASPLYKLMIQACRPLLVQGSLEHPPLVLLPLYKKPAFFGEGEGNLFYKKKQMGLPTSFKRGLNRGTTLSRKGSIKKQLLIDKG